MPVEYTAEDRRRLRRAMFGREAITRADAEILTARFPYNGSTASRIYFLGLPLCILYFAAMATLGMAHHAPAARIAIPATFAVLGLPSIALHIRVRRKIRQALADLPRPIRPD